MPPTTSWERIRQRRVEEDRKAQERWERMTAPTGERPMTPKELAEEKELTDRINASPDKPDVALDAYLIYRGMTREDYSKLTSNHKIIFDKCHEKWASNTKFKFRAHMDNRPVVGYLDGGGSDVCWVKYSIVRIGLIARLYFRAKPLTCGECGQPTYLLHRKTETRQVGYNKWEDTVYTYCPDCWKKDERRWDR